MEKLTIQEELEVLKEEFKHTVEENERIEIIREIGELEQCC